MLVRGKKDDYVLQAVASIEGSQNEEEEKNCSKSNAFKIQEKFIFLK